MAFSRFVFTLFSWPEYVCTTYHFMLMGLPVSLNGSGRMAPGLAEQQPDQHGQSLIHDTDEHGHEQDRDDHDHRRFLELGARRPGDLAELDPHFLAEITNL